MQENSNLTARSRVAELERAFNDFTRTSMQLETAYAELEQRVESLSAALARANDERLAQLAEKERLADRLQGLLQTLPAGVVVLDGQGCVQEYNPGAAALLGEPLSGQPWTDIVERVFARDGDGAREFRLRDGRIVSIATRKLTAQNGRIVLLSDVTETRRLTALLARNERLSEIGQMNARLAHQLRTPLATAVLYASQLESRGTCERSVRYAGKIRASLRHLERMVNDMLRFAGGTRPAAHEQIEVNALFAEVAAQLEAQLTEGVAVEFGAPAGLTLSGDREALVGALLNLATNAIENGGESVHVVLDAERHDRHVELRVRDNGPGIDPERRDKIFEPFYTTRTSGTGLGLAVVASVARGHGGEVRVGDSDTGGAALSILLPMANGPALRSGSLATTLDELAGEVA